MATASANYAYATGGTFLVFLAAVVPFLVQSRIGENTKFSGLDDEQIADALRTSASKYRIAVGVQAALMKLTKELVFTESSLQAIYNGHRFNSKSSDEAHNQMMTDAMGADDEWLKWSPKCKGRWILRSGSTTYALKDAPKKKDCSKLARVAQGKAKDMVAFKFDDSDYALSWLERGRVYENQEHECKGEEGIPFVYFIQPIKYKVLIPKKSLVDADAKFKCVLHYAKGNKPKGCEKLDDKGYEGIPLTLDMALVQPPLDVSWRVEPLCNLYKGAFKECASENETFIEEVEDFFAERQKITGVEQCDAKPVHDHHLSREHLDGEFDAKSVGSGTSKNPSSFAMQQNPVSWASITMVILASLSRLVRA